MIQIEDEPLDSFYPICVMCGAKITDDGYHIMSSWYCDSCMDEFRIDGTEEAEKRREARYEEARESYFDY